MERLTYILFYGLSWFVAVLPRGVMYFNSSVVAFLLYHVVRYRRDVVDENLRYSFPEKSERERKRIARRFYVHLSDLIHESAFMMHASPRRILARCDYVGIEAFEPEFEKGKSVVVAAAHYNNWEFLTTAARASRLKMLSIYKPMHNKRIEQLVIRSRERLGSEAIPMQRVLRRIVRGEREGEPLLIGLIGDQAPDHGASCYRGQFLNQDTLMYKGAEDIAKRFNLPVFFSDMRRGNRRGDYVVHVREITQNPRDTPDGWITAQHAAMLELAIREEPAFWLWSHRRWKTTRK